MSICNIAVLITCHNRRDSTIACLESLFAAAGGNALEVFLVDDGSSDGTGNAVRARFPQVRVLEGSGDLYWVGGMRLAYASATRTPHDHLLWLNDDVVLRPSALETLLSTWRQLSERGHGPSIIAGAVIDPDTGRMAYSGVVRLTKSRPMRFHQLEPDARPQQCETFNGNVVLIPDSVRTIVGDVDGVFTHSMADFDYGLRARALGCEVWLAPGSVGFCRLNVAKGRWREPSTPLRERMTVALSVKGLPPREWMVFTRRYAGVLWPLFWLSPYLNAALGRGGNSRHTVSASGARALEREGYR